MKLIAAACCTATWSIAARATACPDCAAATAVRAALFDQRFWPHLTALALPIAVICAIAALLYRIGIERT